MEQDSRVFINSINQLDMILGRLLIRTKLSDAVENIKNTRLYFDENYKKHNKQVIAESLEILNYHYGDIQSKFPMGSDIEVAVTEQLVYYLELRKNIMI